MKLTLQLLPLLAPLIVLAMLFILVIVMINVADIEPISAPSEFRKVKTQPVTIFNYVSFIRQKRISIPLAILGTALTNLYAFRSRLWVHFLTQVATLRTQLERSYALHHRGIWVPTQQPAFPPSTAHAKTKQTMNDSSVKYSVTAIMEVMTEPGRANVLQESVDLHYEVEMEPDPFRKDGKMTEEGINALMVGFCNGLIGTIRLAGEQNGMNEGQLLRKSMDMLELLFIAQADFIPVAPDPELQS